MRTHKNLSNSLIWNNIFSDASALNKVDRSDHLNSGARNISLIARHKHDNRTKSFSANGPSRSNFIDVLAADYITTRSHSHIA